MLIAEKRQTGFQEVVNRIRRHGAQHREASMADFLVTHDARGDAKDCKELRRPTGLPVLRQGAPSHSTEHRQQRAGALSAGGLVTMHPSAAKGIGGAEGICGRPVLMDSAPTIGSTSIVHPVPIVPSHMLIHVLRTHANDVGDAERVPRSRWGDVTSSEPAMLPDGVRGGLSGRVGCKSPNWRHLKMVARAA